MNRKQMEEIYEKQTGLDAKRGSRRVDIMETTIKEMGLSKGQFKLVDEPSEINNGWRKGRRWSAGKQIGNKICLGYSNRGSSRNNCVNAIFMVVEKKEI